MKLRLLLNTAFLLIAAQVSAVERSLHWRSLDVVARLDAGGKLHVTERQAMVFTGDWNGGERNFRLGPGQRLRFERLTRVDSAGDIHPLVKGDLSVVDGYDFTDRTTLRWRSRLPSQAPFDKTEITYVLEYTLENILVPGKEGQFLLDHDLAFQEREGTILEFTGRLEFDSAWIRIDGGQRELDQHGAIELKRGPLPPGESVIVKIPLRWSGSGAGPLPESAGLPKFMRIAMLCCMVLGAIGAGWALIRHGWTRGVFTPLPPLSVVTPAWLQENLFRFSPEMVSTLWAGATGKNAVAALLSRLACEKKLAWNVDEDEVLHLRLLVDRRSFEGYEARLVNAFFFEGDEIDSERIRKFYRRRGFSPETKIGSALEQKLPALLGTERRARKTFWWMIVALFLTGLLLGVVGGIAGAPIEIVVFSFFPFPFMLLFGGLVAKSFADSAVGHGWRAVLMGIPLLGLSQEILWLASGGLAESFPSGDGISASGLLVSGLLLAWLGSLGLVVGIARTSRGAKGVALHKHLALARSWFAHELRQPQPQLEDGWLPYLLAFGLGAGVDRWFSSYGARPTFDHSPSDGGSDRSGSSTSGSWTGGGGRFSGGGASGSWAALGAVAAGVAAPSSSSSSSGSGSSGGSNSGGGGGGGW